MSALTLVSLHSSTHLKLFIIKINIYVNYPYKYSNCRFCPYKKLVCLLVGVTFFLFNIFKD